MNPEFRRNLWLQLSWPRLALTPVLLGAIFVVVWSSLGEATVSRAAWWGFWAATVLWGTRRAADSVGEEVAGGTWHGQRMSSLGAWAMTWGKLLGATAFAWYVALICLAVHLATWSLADMVSCSTADCFALHARFWPQPIWMIALALSSQAAALAASLAALRRRPLSLRLPVALAQGTGVLLVFALLAPHSNIFGLAADDPLWSALNGYRLSDARPAGWYLWHFDPLRLHQLVIVLMLGLSMLAAYRLMRVALQYRAWPWGLVLGAALVLALASGMQPGMEDGAAGLFWIVAGAVYLGLFTDRIDFPRLQRLVRAVQAAEAATALRLAPSWAAAFVFAVLAGLALMLRGGWPGDLPVPGPGLPAGSTAAAAVLAQLFNLLRDIAIVLWFHLAVSTRRADLGAIVTLGVLYLLLPFAIGASGFNRYLAALGAAGPGLIGIAVAGAAAAWIVLALRWRERARALGTP